ncbi:MAG TPA: hypothetical protein VLU54_00020 [Casimicrobiaceae bacterium]|nr:hypothetical protein [Casimicrobiaceae bacterium]
MRYLGIAASVPLLLGALLLGSFGARAQTTVRNDESLASDRPEAWAMNYIGASTLMTAFGGTPALAAWNWSVALELGHIPRLGEAQQRVGLHGIKQEDLNKAPVFGRLRLLLGLPAHFVAELGYTPPVSISGTQPLDLFALAIQRRVYEHESFALSIRAFGQHGRAHGDITCPAKLAGIADPQQNPFGCQAPSDDHLMLNYYGLEVTPSWAADPWHAYASVGAVRTEFAVQVDALTFDVRDRSRLVARGVLPFTTVGASRALDAHWTLSAELLYVPLRVKRGPDTPSEDDPLTSLRLQLLYRFD